MQGMQEIRVRSLVGKIPRSRNWQPTPVFLPGKFHGQRSLVGYSPWGCKESDTSEQLHFYFQCLLEEYGISAQRFIRFFVFFLFFERENLKLEKIFSSPNNYFSLCKLEKRLSLFSFKNRKLP